MSGYFDILYVNNLIFSNQSLIIYDLLGNFIIAFYKNFFFLFQLGFFFLLYLFFIFNQIKHFKVV